MSRSAERIERMASLLSLALSEGRRTGAVLVGGPERAFATNLTTIAVPFPLPDGGDPLRTMAAAVALQAAPSKECAAELCWWALSRRRRRALAWVEGEAAVRWAARRWPGLAPELAQRFPWVAPDWAAIEPPELSAAAERRMRGRLSPPPALFGLLPQVRPSHRLGTTRKTFVGTPWTTREINPRHLPESIPVTGTDGEDVVVPGLPDGLEALDGHGRRLLGVPYDEWDAHRGGYRRDHVRVIELRAAVAGDPQARVAFPPTVSARARQRHRETGDVDVDAVIGWRCDLATGMSPADARLFCDLVPVEQPVTWSLLVDGSASAAAGAGGVFRRALLAADSAAGALAARAHPVAVSVFRSFTRERVEVHILKEFDERYRPLGPGPGLRPDGYTRLGAALRHAGRRLLDRPGPARVLVSLGDALPTDEGYDGAYARADVAKAVEELRRSGALVVHVAVAPVDPAALHEMFGPGGWREARTPEDLAPLVQDVATTLRRAS